MKIKTIQGAPLVTLEPVEMKILGCPAKTTRLRLSPLKAIRKQCLDCAGDSREGVRFCGAIDCALWFYRFGEMPKTHAKKHSEDFFSKEHFVLGGKFWPFVTGDESYICKKQTRNECPETSEIRISKLAKP